eukprot:PhM_4_TR13060/c0_g1_i1/m.44156
MIPPKRDRKPTQTLEAAMIKDLVILMPLNLQRKVQPKKKKIAKKIAKPIAVKPGAKKAPRKAAAKKTTAAKKVAAPKKKLATRKVAPKTAANANFGIPTLQRGNSRTGSGAPAFKWQFYDDGNKWSDYDAVATKALEKAYVDWQKNPHIDVRSVKSGQWHYMVDFNLMQQQNIDHENHRIRKIQRIKNN